MSSKNAKKARKGVVSELSSVWLPVPGLKFLGKQTYLGFAVYDSETVGGVFVENSVNFNFTSLSSPTVVLPLNVLKGFLSEDLSGKSLGVVVLTDLSAVVSAGEGWVLEGDTLPFKVGEPIGWRNPRFGHLVVEDDEQVLADLKSRVAFLGELFPGFDDIYWVEQVVSPAGFSDSFVNRLIGFLKTLKV